MTTIEENNNNQETTSNRNEPSKQLIKAASVGSIFTQCTGKKDGQHLLYYNTIKCPHIQDDTNHSMSLRLKASGRRMTQNLLHAFGQAYVSKDSEYLGYLSRFQSLICQLENIIKSVESFRNALSIYSKSCYEMGKNIENILRPEDVGMEKDPEKFGKAFLTIGSSKPLPNSYQTIDGSIVNVLTSLKKKLMVLKSYEDPINKREAIKLKYDIQCRKYDATNGKLSKKSEEKLNRSKQGLQAATDDLYRVFAYYEAQRDCLFSAELETIRTSQLFFFTIGMNSCSFKLNQMDVTIAPVYERAEKIFSSMKGEDKMKHNVVQMIADKQKVISSSTPVFEAKQIADFPMEKYPPPPTQFLGLSIHSRSQRKRMSHTLRQKYGTYSPGLCSHSDKINKS